MKELRILCGVHAGARTSLQPGEQALTLGRSADHDIVLRDSPAQGTVTLTSDGWTWSGRPGVPSVALPLGVGVRFGTVVLTVDDARAPWPDVDQLEIEAEPMSDAELSPLHEVVPELESMTDEPTEMAATSELPVPTDGEPPPSNIITPAITEKFPARRLSRRRVPGWAIAVTGGAAVIWLSLALWPTPSTQAVAAAPAASSVNADSVRELVASLGLSESLRVLTEQPDGLKVVGVVDDDVRRDTLRERLAALEPIPASNILTQPEFKTEVDALAKSLEPGLKLVAKDRATVLLSGVVNEPTEVDALSQRIAVELPTAVRVEKAIKTSAEVVAGFSEELHRLGLPMRARLEGDRMLVEGRLARPRVAQWEALILNFNKHYGERIPFVASLDEEIPVAADADAPASASSPPAKVWLPRIDSVVGGDAPYLVLADGRKVMPGGTLNGYELVAIRNDSLVVRDGQGKLREVAR